MVVKWDFMTRWQRHFRATLGLAIGFSIFGIIGLCALRENLQNANSGSSVLFCDVIMSIVAAYILFAACIAFYCFVGNTFNNMKTKVDRETYLMLPASNLEKYLGRVFNMTIGGLAQCILAIAIADFIQLAFSIFITPEYHTSLTFHVFSRCCLFIKELPVQDAIAMSVFLCSTGLFVHSFYTLGSAFFRKASLLLTTAAGLFLAYIVIYFTKDFVNISITINDGTGTFCYSSLIYDAILCVLSVINYLASYKIFSRMQVINNKWINI